MDRFAKADKAPQGREHATRAEPRPFRSNRVVEQTRESAATRFETPARVRSPARHRDSRRVVEPNRRGLPRLLLTRQRHREAAAVNGLFTMSAEPHLPRGESAAFPTLLIPLPPNRGVWMPACRARPAHIRYGAEATERKTRVRTGDTRAQSATSCSALSPYRRPLF